MSNLLELCNHMYAANDSHERRREIRFRPRPDWASFVDTDHGPVSVFVVDASARGLGLIMWEGEWGPAVGQQFEIRVGPLAPRTVRIVWMHPSDTGTVRCGAQYVDRRTDADALLRRVADLTSGADAD